jgi:ketosteroid isomerase-like protein
MKIVFLFLIVVLFFTCQQKTEPGVDQLLDADKQFSAKAGEVGFNNAFIDFAHPDAVLLRPNTMPIKGKPAISSFYENANVTGINFSWEPSAGDIAASGELGYTYGIYTLKTDTLTQKGTYVSIWKKDENSNWKYVLDTGNEGIGK